jgi:hypothetical protein
MVKKDILLGKASKMYSNQIVYFGTKHQKERAIFSLLSEVGLNCLVAEIDTDQFGTFSGEIKRIDSVKKTLQKKINEVLIHYPDAQFAMASEGSFGPHPLIPFANANHEAILFVDKKKEFEIYVDEYSFDTNLSEIEIGIREKKLLDSFLEKVQFPSHAVMIKKSNEPFFKHKGIQNKAELLNYIEQCFLESEDNRIIISTDMRAMFNPTRMKNIYQVGKKLIKALQTFCPVCSVPGFHAYRSIPGLECSLCGCETDVARETEWKCVKCEFLEIKERDDHLKYADPAECPYCNP